MWNFSDFQERVHPICAKPQFLFVDTGWAISTRIMIIISTQTGSIYCLGCRLSPPCENGTRS